MLAGASLPYWIGFHALVVALLFVDLVVLQRGHNVPSPKVALWWTAVVALLALAFAALLAHAQGRQSGLEFVSGYLIEGSLSVDNLFVFLLMFRALGLSREEQRRALLWGVLGAVLMRAAFIAAGVSLLTRFAWVQYVFGMVLLVAAIRLLRESPAKAKPSRLVQWIRGRSAPPAPGTAGGVPLAASSMILVIAGIELTDLLFALDSIPAVLAITRSPFIVYTSNIFAILGLRSLYFVLSHLLDRLRLLHYGLAVILGFVALKMLLARWLVVPVGVSLAVILGILAVFVVASLYSAKSSAKSSAAGHTLPD